MARPICEVCGTYEGTPHRETCPFFDATEAPVKPIRRKLLAEAEGTFAIGDVEHVMEYLNRLRDLPLVGPSLFSDVEQAFDEMKRAEERLLILKRRWRDKAMNVFRYATNNWTHKEVQEALFGKR